MLPQWILCAVPAVSCITSQCIYIGKKTRCSMMLQRVSVLPERKASAEFALLNIYNTIFLLNQIVYNATSKISLLAASYYGDAVLPQHNYLLCSPVNASLVQAFTSQHFSSGDDAHVV